jgi:hypothetical protein
MKLLQAGLGWKSVACKQDQDGTQLLASRIRMEISSILILLASSQQTYITYTIAVGTVKNS